MRQRLDTCTVVTSVINSLTSYHYGYSFDSIAPQIHCLQEPRFLSLASLLALFFDDYAKSIGLDMILE